MNRRQPPTPDQLLLALHAATEVDELWHAVLPLLRSAMAPCVRVTLFLGHFEMREARLVYTDPPIERAAEWYMERGRINPFTAYIAAHRRVRHYRFSDVVGSKASFGRTEFYRRFARPEGWDKGMSGLFWRGDEVKAMFSLYRAPAQPEFDAADIARIEALQPHIETAIDRVQELQHERLRRRVLEEFNRHLPIGLLLLDWDLRPVFTNHQAVRECAVWNHGPEVARGLVSRDHLVMPAAVREVCERLRTEILRANAKERLRFPQRMERLAHPLAPERIASVSAVNAAPGLLARPGFLVVLEDRTGEPRANAGVTQERLRLLWMLTPSEREIALLICEGCSNQEIARRRKKSLLTIKKQVTSVFAKLNVPSRARLMALLR
ncbi:MAG: helix-turn-helix transcriptional regulator [Verrucomicrobia bacterium]|nr:helix-turn-helix transcriptional regulator [Verrucomicrobiota bacterium]